VAGAKVDGPAIFREGYELALMLHEQVTRFPRASRHVLGQRIVETAVGLLASLVEANMAARKEPRLEEVSLALEKLRIFVRLARDTQCVDFKKYEAAAVKIDTVGRMLGGWRKWAGGASPVTGGRQR